MRFDPVIDRLSARIAALAGRIHKTADLQELIRRDQLPQSPVAAFLLPLGLAARSEGDASSGLFVQSVDTLFAVVLVVRAAGDGKGEKGLVSLEALVPAVTSALCGFSPDESQGSLRLTRGRLVSLQAGTAFYQVEFAIESQIRVTP